MDFASLGLAVFGVWLSFSKYEVILSCRQISVLYWSLLRKYKKLTRDLSLGILVT